jgi:hypothetical protein
MPSNIKLAAFISSLLSQPFAATNVEDGDGDKKHCCGKKNDVEHMLLFLD